SEVNMLFEDLDAPGIKIYPLDYDVKGCVLVMNMDEELASEKFLNTQCTKIKQTLASQFTLTAGIGRIYTSPEMLHESFKEAELAISFRFTMGNDRIISYQDIIEQFDDSAYHHNIDTEHKLIAAIKQ